MSTHVQRALVLLVGAALCSALCACSCSQGPAENETHASDTKPRPLLPNRPVSEAFDQVAVLEALEAEAGQVGRVRVFVRFEPGDTFRLGPLAPGAKKVQREQLRIQQEALLTKLGRSPLDKDVRLVLGLPCIAYDATPADLGQFRRRLQPLGKVEVQTDAGPVTVRVERADPLAAQSTSAAFATPIQDVLTRMEMDDTVATGAGFLVVVIDTPIQPDALPLVARLEDPPALVAAITTSPLAISNGITTHGTKVASVVAVAAPGCSIVPIGLQPSNGKIPPDAVLDALQRLYHAEETDFLSQVAAVCISLASPTNHVSGACAFDPDSPADATLFQLAVWNLTASGVPVVVAAGSANGASCQEVFEPWCMTFAFCTGCTDGAELKRSQFSPWSELVDVCAPGGGVSVQIANGYGPVSLNGTSIAAPMVAAMCARFAEKFTGLSGAERVEAIQNGGLQIEDCSLKVPEVRFRSAVQQLVGIPPTPTPPEPDPPDPSGPR